MGEDLRIALAAFAARPRVLVALDFDGTLAPFVTDPLRARAVPGGLEALRAATALGGVTTAVVSGRDLATLAMLTGIGPDEGITLIGSHGAQTNSGDRAELVSATGAAFLDDAAAALLETLRDELEVIRSRYPAVRLEYKPAAVVLHTRDVEKSAADAATKAAHEAGRRLAGVHVMPGKEVVELSVSAADKGSSLAGLARASSSDATLYVGDDVTDERAFAALHPLSGDLTVKVGDGATVAVQRVPDPEAVVELLKLFVDVRRLQG
ncbi:MAG: trehalose-phosphatase [Actinomycetota bacterium]